MSADCSAGATSARAYKDGIDSGVAYIVDGKITKTFSDIEDGITHIYGLSAIYGDVESEITEEEYTAIIEAKILTVDEYIPNVSTWVTGTYRGTLAKKVGIYVNGEKIYAVPMKQEERPKFKYYRNGILATDTVKVWLATADDKELDQADVPIKQEEKLEE
ncbi:hypothetical protein I4L49_001482 [Enterococcus faecium]|nr:hypothetical protein [Enterococcus faecium]EMF0264492.1 hypothetical protein [Enterococcus hirae]EMF0428607.1 hypothetical protein [Enterococcus faecium]